MAHTHSFQASSSTPRLGILDSTTATAANMMFSMHKKSTSSPIMKLPNELLAEIAGYISTRHEVSEYAIEVKNLASLAATNRALHDVTTPLLFKDVVIASEAQLEALASVPNDLLELVSELNIFVNADLLAAFRTAAARPSSTRSALSSLAKVLAHTPSLTALRVLVAHTSGPESAWTRSVLRSEGIPIGAAFTHALECECEGASPRLEKLATMELDVFSDIGPLLGLAPNLATLRAYISAGFAQLTNYNFVHSALSHVPHLKRLTYSPASLRITSALEEAEAELERDGEAGEVDYSAELLRGIGEVCKELEDLDLTARWHAGDDIAFVSSDAPITTEGVVNATKHLPNLKHLQLPTSIFTQADFDAVRAPLKLEPTQDELAGRRAALDTVAQAERELVGELSSTLSSLETISFVRPVEFTDRHDLELEYLSIHPPPTSSSSSLSASADMVLAPSIHPATAHQHDALPRPPAPFKARWAHFMEEHPTVGIAAAIAGGIALSEASRVIYARTTGKS